MRRFFNVVDVKSLRFHFFFFFFFFFFLFIIFGVSVVQAKMHTNTLYESCWNGILLKYRTNQKTKIADSSSVREE